ncbi:GerAB/ArcD/ProY family transporter [Bacillus niameyensis]|uniref:GerAB/ArcD/ProY family transporter n=1 Tax=Bacillus niameyensis TaxID=1522308 RepID=UPI0007845271|nr:GerAB/ArcD/ProY family transporter [Bacillus niameyensis]
MEVNVNVKPRLRFRAFYLFFIIFGVQTGVGILGAPRFIYQEAGRDAWVSILIAYLMQIIVVYVMVLVLRQYKNTDIFGIQVDLFGKWVGKALGAVYIIYFAASFFSILITYIEVVQIFLYPTLSSYMIGGLLLIIVVYAVLGGLRIIIGVTVIFPLLVQWFLILLYVPIIKMDWLHFLPMFQASIPELLHGARATSYSLSGFEIFFVLYPFIEDKEKVKLPMFLGMGYTTFLILITTVIVFGYYSLEDLHIIDFSVLAIFKSVSYTFIERLDFIVVAQWVFVIIPNLVLLMWAITYGMKRLYRVPQRIMVYIVSLIMLILASFIKYDIIISKLVDTISLIGFWLIFVYPLILLPLVWIKKKWRKLKGSAAQ